MMKMLLLILCCVVGASADSQHEDIRILGCSDLDGEFMYGLDSEEVWYADFSKGEGVDINPPFIDPITYEEGAYSSAVADLQTCKTSLDITRKSLKDMPPERVAPTSPVIYTKEEVQLSQQNTLICFVTGFYPAPVNVSWTRNGEHVTQGTSINVPYPNKEGTFTQISRLAFVPQQGDIYSCRVQHPALSGQDTRMWTVEVQQPGVGPAVFCGLGLTLGLLGVAAGTFFLIKGNECR
eukprot:XP_011618264.1 PREDICTED: h-2 class II histocompatibility antigen, A-K alpha chain-like isoform X1 [Takifugu rubripes]